MKKSDHKGRMTCILVIDDDTELCELLSDYLGPEGFVVESVHDGIQGAERALAGGHDLVVLDVMLPGMNGFDVLREIRGASTVPVLMLTARGEDVDRIVGLEMGADDYLPKPFNPRELVARIRAIVRRAVASGKTDSLGVVDKKTDEVIIGDIELNGATQKVKREGRNIVLTAVEFSMLQHLLESAGKVVSRYELAEKVLGRKLEMFDRSVDVHISSLRKKLGNYSDEQERIISVRGVGYQYILHTMLP